MPTGIIMAALMSLVAAVLPFSAGGAAVVPYNPSPFYLPFPAGTSYRVIQGNTSVTGDHTGGEAYAWDFSMPEGSLVLAPRDGTVLMTKSDSNAGGYNYYNGYFANYVVIDHGDGTQSLYLHLMYHGVLVQPGQHVVRGQPIAYSGDTGFSGGPHLHFAVEQYGTADRVTESLPAAFADVASWDGVPLSGRTYTSGNQQVGAAEPRPLVAAERLPRNPNSSRPNPYANRLDFPLPHGHFYLQGNGQGGTGRLGFLVADDDNVPFNAVLDQLGGPAIAGYPISRRFTFGGRTTQVFQKLVLQYHDEDGSVQVLNTMDLLHDAGDDAALQARLIPPPASTAPDAALPWPDVVARHEAFLAGSAPLQQAYAVVADPLTVYGLPMTAPVDEGAALVVRTQRAVLQLWKQDEPWAVVGQVTVANGGDLAKELGLFPADALKPEPQPIP
jgi:murein DD-endopeptidase MepM/ murein hydrolase activator NlpD